MLLLVASVVGGRNIIYTLTESQTQHNDFSTVYEERQMVREKLSQLYYVL